MKVIVMGCGRVGSMVSTLLAAEGHQVTVIDNREPGAAERLGPNFKGRLLHGLGFDQAVLMDSGIKQADAFVAASPSDNANIVAARIARNIFHVPRVICRTYDPRKARIYERLGLQTLAISTWGAERIMELVIHSDLDLAYNFGHGEVSLLVIEAPHALEGRQVRHLLIPGEISVVSITRKGAALIPGPGAEIQEGDFIHFAVASTSLTRFEELIGIERRD
jgi:trk system potassium uptake protein TrkA